MSTVNPKTIVLRGNPTHHEAQAGAAGILPGHLIRLSSTSGDVLVHNVAAGFCAPMFAREEDYVGGTISDAYADNDRIPYVHCQGGDEIYALLPASAAAVVIGDLLESNGDGTLKKTTRASTNTTTAIAHPIAIALQAVDNSGGGAAVRIKVRII
jgi:hypothetical protein